MNVKHASTASEQGSPEVKRNGRPASRTSRGGTSLLAHGERMIWLTGGSMVICVVMILGLLTLIVAQGITTFWPRPLVEIQLVDGRHLLGQVTRSETEPSRDGNPEIHRDLYRTGNFELTGRHFEWINDTDITDARRPEWAVLLERRSWGRFYGYPQRFLIDGRAVAEGGENVWVRFERYHDKVSERFERIYNLEKYEFGEIHAAMERARLQLRKVELKSGHDSREYAAAKTIFDGEIAAIEQRKGALAEEIRLLETENDRYGIVFSTADGAETTIKLSEIVRAVPANRIGLAGKIGVYASRWWEFLTADPRSANSEGGVWPAIVGTVIMTLLMSLAVVPFGVLAALYLREYAKEGPIVSAVRIAVNNLAGVPSIVFGVFGLGFFCYIMGGTIDQMFFSARLPNPTYGKGGVMWAALTLALLTLPVVVVATEEALAAVPGSMREGSYACGASRWQTIRRIVLPRAMPGIMTGFILAMARGAGEVAPLMLVGAAKLAPDLPIDGVLPYLHPERSFMHLGFHIYDVGFQSQNSEAAKPMVFTTTLLLILIIAALNLSSVWVRTRLRRRFVGGKF